MTESGGWTFRDGRPGRFGVVFAAVWLVFLTDTVRVAWDALPRPEGWIGLASTLAFMALYLNFFTWLRARRMRLEMHVSGRRAAAILGSLFLLMVLMCLSLGQAGVSATVYIAVVSVMCLPARPAAALVLALAAGVEVTGDLVPGWQRELGLSFAICAAAFAVWGVQQLMARNVDLMRAREENARLAVEEERGRFARDLHDILGHSLTVITVKAELAARLFDVDQDRARAELADLERLSRDALADVRRAVEGYRELTLPGELARARAALQAADIEADVPNAADDVPSELRELFAWTVREGVTNVIRHSGATRCTVRLAADRVEVRDDGTGPSGDGAGPSGPPRRGHGLDGLRERASAANAVLVTRTLVPGGFELAVSAR